MLEDSTRLTGSTSYSTPHRLYTIALCRTCLKVTEITVGAVDDRVSLEMNEIRAVIDRAYSCNFFRLIPRAATLLAAPSLAPLPRNLPQCGSRRLRARPVAWSSAGFP